ncbi:MAG: energy-coupling factor transporter transmembrane component T family protein [Promethearchaeota archaeon]
MDTILPFRHEDEKTLLNNLHPLVRMILPFIFIIPFLFINNVYLIFSFIIITFIFSLATRLNILRILSRLKSIVPFIILITIFLPFYIGQTVAYRIEIGITITLYSEGLYRAFLTFMRIFGATYIFMSFFSSLTYSEFIEALTTLRLPSFFVGSFMIMLHYIPIIVGSNKKILDAQELRGKKIINYLERLKAHAYIMGKSLVMNMESSEKLYESLKMRGFTGKLTFAPKKIRFHDILILILFVGISIYLIYFIDLKSIYLEVVSLLLP